MAKNRSDLAEIQQDLASYPWIYRYLDKIWLDLLRSQRDLVLRFSQIETRFCLIYRDVIGDYLIPVEKCEFSGWRSIGLVGFDFCVVTHQLTN